MPSQLLAIIILCSYLYLPWLYQLNCLAKWQGQYLMSVLVSTRHTILCMCDWVQCVGFCWGLALVLGLMCRIWLGPHPMPIWCIQKAMTANREMNIAAMRWEVQWWVSPQLRRLYVPHMLPIYIFHFNLVSVATGGYYFPYTDRICSTYHRKL